MRNKNLAEILFIESMVLGPCNLIVNKRSFTNYLVQKINEYAMMQSYDHDYAFGLVSMIEGKNIFDYHFDLVSEKWVSWHKYQVEIEDYTMMQTGFNTNLISPQEIIRLNPKCSSIKSLSI